MVQLQVQYNSFYGISCSIIDDLQNVKFDEHLHDLNVCGHRRLTDQMLPF